MGYACCEVKFMNSSIAAVRRGKENVMCCGLLLVR